MALRYFAFDILSVDILRIRYFAIRYFAIRYFAIRYFATSIFCGFDILWFRCFAFDILRSIFCESIFCPEPVWTPPPRTVFREWQENDGAAPPGFHLPYPHLFSTFVKVSILGHARSGHKVRSSGHTLQKLYNRATTTVFKGNFVKLETMKLCEYYRVISTYKMYILDFLYLWP